MAKKRTMRMKKRYNKKSKKGGFINYFRQKPSDPFNSVKEISKEDINKQFGTNYNSIYDNDDSINNTSRVTNNFNTQSPDGSLNMRDSEYERPSQVIDQQEQIESLQKNYQLKCPKKFGFFENSSYECKELKNQYEKIRMDIQQDKNQIQGMVNYQGYAPPPKKPWYKFWGGKTKRGRTHRKKHTVRKRRH